MNTKSIIPYSEKESVNISLERYDVLRFKEAMLTIKEKQIEEIEKDEFNSFKKFETAIKKFNEENVSKTGTKLEYDSKTNTILIVQMY